MTIVFIQNSGPALILLAPAMVDWRTPDAADWFFFLMIGFAGVAGHLLLAMAFARVQAALLAPLEYTALVWGVLLDATLWGVLPDAATWLGAGIIIASGLYLLRRERVHLEAERP